jgi:hypothetical protein
VAEGKLEELSFTAPAGGVVHVVDANDRKVLHRERIEQGQQIVVVPHPGSITVGGRRISRQDIDMNHRLRVYFGEGATAADR